MSPLVFFPFGFFLIVVFRKTTAAEFPIHGPTRMIHSSESNPKQNVLNHFFVDSSGMIGKDHWAVGYRWDGQLAKWVEVARGADYQFQVAPVGGGGAEEGGAVGD